MADIHQAITFTIAALACLLGILLVMSAGRSTQRRGLLCAATIAIGAIGVWLTNLIAAIGQPFPHEYPRIAPAPALLALLAALATTAPGLVLAGPAGAAGAADTAAARVRRLAAALLLGLGSTGTNVLILRAIRVPGTIDFDWERITLAAMVMTSAGCLALRLTLRSSGLRTALGGAMIAAIGICLAHRVALSALQIRPRLDGASWADTSWADTGWTTGLSDITLLVPLCIGAVVALTALAYLALTSAAAAGLCCADAGDPDGRDSGASVAAALAEISARAIDRRPASAFAVTDAIRITASDLPARWSDHPERQTVLSVRPC